MLEGISGLKIVLLSLDDWLASEYGLFLSHTVLSPEVLWLSALVILASIVVSIFPGIEAYKNALHMQLSGK